MPPMHQHNSMLLDLNASNASELFHVIGPQCLQSIRTIPYYWTSMPPMHQNYSILFDLNASNASQLFQPPNKQASQPRQHDSHPTSKPANKSARQSSNKQFLARGRGGAGRPQADGGGGFPRTLESGRSLGPTCPGTKYPVRGISHFDLAPGTEAR